ncbi:MAG TPA: hypothetical protein VHG93_28805 [Longimicrobium sp.]|nr:hypothetical protein [Longimicrobium sp.]
MANWNLTDADGRLSMVALEALCSGPQFVTLDGEVDLVVLSPEEYGRLTGESLAASAAERQAEAAPGVSMFTLLRQPFEEAAAPGEDVYWPWHWDREKREWVLPEDHAVPS